MRQEVAPFRKSLPQLRSAANFALSIHPLGGEAPAIEALMAAREVSDRVDVCSRLSTLINIATNIEANELVPERFRDAIKFGCRRANIQLHDLTNNPVIGWKLHDWVQGCSMPDRFASFGAVKELERLLRFEPGTLWDRVRFRSCGGTISKEFWPPEIPNSAHLKSEIKQYLPDDILTMPEQERRDFFLKAYGIVLVKREKHVDDNHARNCRDPYWHKKREWSSVLLAGFEKLLKFHSVSTKIDLSKPPRGSLWVEGTQDRNTGFIEKTMGAALKLGMIAMNELTLALFVNPQIVLNAVEFVKKRRRLVKLHGLSEEVHPYERDDIQLFVFGKMMVAKDGFLRLSPEFYGELSQSAKEMLASQFPEAGDNWFKICDAALAGYENAIAQAEKFLRDRGS